MHSKNGAGISHRVNKQCPLVDMTKCSAIAQLKRLKKKKKHIPLKASSIQGGFLLIGASLKQEISHGGGGGERGSGWRKNEDGKPP